MHLFCFSASLFETKIEEYEQETNESLSGNLESLLIKKANYLILKQAGYTNLVEVVDVKYREEKVQVVSKASLVVARAL